MDNNKIETFNIENKYLADGLSFCGYRYYRYTTETGKTIYSFSRTQEFMDCFNKILEIKKIYGQFYKD